MSSEHQAQAREVTVSDNNPTTGAQGAGGDWFGAVVTGAVAFIGGLLLERAVPGRGWLGAALAASLAQILLAWRRDLTSHALATWATARSLGETAELPETLSQSQLTLATAVERLANKSHVLEMDVTDAAQSLRGFARQVGPSTASIRHSLISDQEAESRALELISKISQQVEALGRLQQEFALATEETQSSALQLTTTNKAVGENVQSLAGVVDETAASIEEMSYSIKEVARNIEELSLAAEQTATSMNQMDSSISEVETNVRAAAQLADEVAQDAGKGAEAVHRTLEGIDKIRATVTTASSVIAGLGERIREIGNILSVIEDVAEQTNLLALNAAIIAAQAGEHGRGFAVVADEIKELADKTGASTKEIAALIRNIQDESRNAVEAINTGERHVQDGVGLSRAAENALAKILDSSVKSTKRFRTIAAATVEQARGSKLVADAVERIARSVQQVAAATAEQARGSEQLMTGTERIKGVTAVVERNAQEQSQGSRHIMRFVEQIGDQLQRLDEIQGGMKEACGDLRHQLESLAQEHLEAAEHLAPFSSLPQQLDEQADRITTTAARARSGPARPS